MAGSADSFVGVLAEISRLSGTDFMPDDLGVVTFDLDGVPVSLEADERSDVVYAHCPVDLAAENEAASLRQAMELNLFRTEPVGSWFAYDADAKGLLLCRTVQKEGLTPDSLLAMVESMAEAARAYRHRARPSSGPDRFDVAPYAEMIRL